MAIVWPRSETPILWPSKTTAQALATCPGLRPLMWGSGAGFFGAGGLGGAGRVRLRFARASAFSRAVSRLVAVICALADAVCGCMEIPSAAAPAVAVQRTPKDRKSVV